MNLYNRLLPKYKKYLDQHAEQFPNVYGHLKNELENETLLAKLGVKNTKDGLKTQH